MERGPAEEPYALGVYSPGARCGAKGWTVSKGLI